MFGSSCSKAARVERYINGNEMTAAAITAACHVNTSVTSNCNKNFPIGLRLPKVTNKKKPATVGGNTSGNIITASTKVLPRLRLHTKRAKNIPAKKIPDGLKFVGIRADLLTVDTGENFFTFEVAAVVEDVDAFDVIVRRAGKRLIWRVNKNRRPQVGDEISLSLPADKIFLFG